MEGTGLPAFAWRIAEGADALFTVVVVLGALAEMALMYWAFRTIAAAIRRRREERDSGRRAGGPR